MDKTMVQMTREEWASDFREKLAKLEKSARVFIEEIKSYEMLEGEQRGEQIAHATLAMRHIEDARMRYGKVIQYLGDGISKFDK